MKLVSAKFSVAVSTLISNPEFLYLDLPLPVLKKVGVMSRIGGGVFCETTCGFRISAPELGVIIPDPASNDSMLGNSVNIIPTIPFSSLTPVFFLDCLNFVIPGPPYRIKIEIQNAEAAQVLYGALFFWCDENKNPPPLKLAETPNNEP